VVYPKAREYVSTSVKCSLSILIGTRRIVPLTNPIYAIIFQLKCILLLIYTDIPRPTWLVLYYLQIIYPIHSLACINHYSAYIYIYIRLKANVNYSPLFEIKNHNTNNLRILEQLNYRILLYNRHKLINKNHKLTRIKND
jgi:hypothetical protein